MPTQNDEEPKKCIIGSVCLSDAWSPLLLSQTDQSSFIAHPIAQENLAPAPQGITSQRSVASGLICLVGLVLQHASFYTFRNPNFQGSFRTPARSWDEVPLFHLGSQKRSCIPPSIHPVDQGLFGYSPQSFGHCCASGS